jgi:mRNA interferase MazF
MNRGAIVIVSGRGSLGSKPRPAVIVQTDSLIESHPTILVAPITSEFHDFPLFRINLQPTPENGLRVPCQIMSDSLITVRRRQIDRVVGQLDPENLSRLERALFVVLGLG